MKKVCIEKPTDRCRSGSLSAMKARKGSIVTLIEESSTHMSRAAIQSAEEKGISSRQMLEMMAPIRK